MPTAGNVQFTQGSGTRLGTSTYTEGCVTVHDEKFVLGEQYLASYVVNGAAISMATINDHLIQLMAGSTLNVYVRRIVGYQVGLATSAAIQDFRLFRISSAGTGGTSLSEFPLNPADAASGAQAMTLPTAKGTETNRMWVTNKSLMQTAPTAGADLLLFDWVFDGLRTPSLIIPAGITNGIAVKNTVATAAASCNINILFTEASF